MLPFLYISGWWIELYYIFNFLGMFLVVFLGLYWNYKYGPKYPLGLGILFFIAPFEFFLLEDFTICSHPL